MSTSIGGIEGTIGLRDEFSEGLNRISERVTSFGKNARTLGTALLPLSGALTAAGVAGFKFSNDFNAAMANVGTLIPGNTARVLELKEAVKDMAVDVGKSTGDLSGGLYQVISAFQDSADTVDILRINAEAAAAGLATTTDAINLTSAVTKGYGVVNKETVQHVADLAFQTVKLGQTTFPELAGSMGKTIPIAAALGVKQEELFAAFATFTGVTGNADEASTQLRATMSSMLNPTDAMTAAMDKLGVSSVDAMIKQYGLRGSVQALIKETDGSKKAIGELFPQIRALPAVFAAVGGQAATYTQRLVDMQAVSGTAKTAFGEIADGVNKTGFAWDQLKSQLGIVTSEFGDALAPAALNIIEIFRTQLLPAVSSAIAFFKDLDTGTQTVAIALGTMGAAAAPALISIGFLAQGIGALIGVAGSISAGLTVLGNTVPILTARVWLLNAGFAGLTGAIAAVATPLATFILSYSIAKGLLENTETGRTAIEFWADFTLEIQGFNRAAVENAGMVDKVTGRVLRAEEAYAKVQANAKLWKEEEEKKKAALEQANAETDAATKATDAYRERIKELTDSLGLSKSKLAEAGADIATVIENLGGVSNLSLDQLNGALKAIEDLYDKGGKATPAIAALATQLAAMKVDQTVLDFITAPQMTDTGQVFQDVGKAGHLEQDKTAGSTILNPEDINRSTAAMQTYQNTISQLAGVDNVATGSAQELAASQAMNYDATVASAAGLASLLQQKAEDNASTTELTATYDQMVQQLMSSTGATEEQARAALDGAGAQKVLDDAAKDTAITAMDVAQGFADAGSILSALDTTLGKFGIDANSGIGQLLTGMQDLASAGNEGAAAFAAFSSGDIVGGITHAITAVGSLASAIHNLFGGPSELEQAGKAAGHIYGTAMGEEIAQAVLDTANALNVSDEVASLLHLTDAMGASEEAASTFAPQMEALIAGIADGTVPATQGMEQLGQAFGDLVSEAEMMGGASQAALTDILSTARRAGTMTEEMRSYQAEQLDSVVEGMSAFVSAVAGIEGDIGRLGGNSATIFMAGFNALIADRGLVAAYDAMAESGAQLADQLGVLGDSAAAAIMEPFTRAADLLGNEALRPLVEGIDGLGQVWQGLANTDFLDTTQFTAMQQASADLFDQIVAGGGDTATALSAVAPQIQNAINMAERFGVPLDEDMQRMREMAEQNDITFSSDPMERVAVAIEAIARGMGFLPAAAEHAAASMSSSFGSAATYMNEEIEASTTFSASQFAGFAESGTASIDALRDGFAEATGSMVTTTGVAVQDLAAEFASVTEDTLPEVDDGVQTIITSVADLQRMAEHNPFEDWQVPDATLPGGGGGHMPSGVASHVPIPTHHASGTFGQYEATPHLAVIGDSQEALVPRTRVGDLAADIVRQGGLLGRNNEQQASFEKALDKLERRMDRQASELTDAVRYAAQVILGGR